MQSPDSSHLVWTGPLGGGIKKLVVFRPFLGPQGPLRVPSSVLPQDKSKSPTRTDRDRPGQTRREKRIIQSRGPNSRTCVLVLKDHSRTTVKSTRRPPLQPPKISAVLHASLMAIFETQLYVGTCIIVS